MEFPRVLRQVFCQYLALMQWLNGFIESSVLAAWVFLAIAFAVLAFAGFKKALQDFGFFFVGYVFQSVTYFIHSWNFIFRYHRIVNTLRIIKGLLTILHYLLLRFSFYTS